MSDISSVFSPTIDNLNQNSTWSYGVLKNLNDPDCLGRGCLEVSGHLDEGEDNWSNYADFVGVTLSGVEQRLASGMWWPGQPGDLCLFGLKDGDPFQPIAIPGLSWANEPGKKKQAILPGEVKTVADKNTRESTRVRTLSDEAGSSLLMCSIAGREYTQLLDFTGAGFFSICPGVGEDPREEEGGESKRREAYSREDNSVMAQTSKEPSEILKDGKAILGVKDLNGSNILFCTSDGAGVVTIQASNKNGDVTGPSIVLDAKKNLITFTAGNAQFVINGTKEQIESTKTIIQEQPKVSMDKQLIGYQDFIKNNVKYFTKAAT